MMRHSAPNHVIQRSISKPTGTKTSTIVCTIVIVIVLIGVIAIALGVGLGVGLRKKSNSSSRPCGTSAIQPTFLSTKIIDGHEATPHSWPWIVALYYNGGFICGGFLATSSQIVITAAHCVSFTGFNSKSLRIYAGLHTRSSLGDGQVRSVSSYKAHPSYDSTKILNDIAVLKLTSAFDTNDNVGLCCLPSGSTQLPILNETGIIVGWGDTIAGVSSSLSDNLRQAEIKIEGSSLYCDASSTSDVQFCAGYGTRDTCEGDSGGPLMTNVNNTWACTGIVSHGAVINGVACGHSAYYARVSYFRSFIDSTISTL